MPLVMVASGAMSALRALLALYGGSHRVGLFQNDWSPAFGDDITRVTPCNFSGYDGLHDLIGWSAPVIIGDQAVSFATPRLWTHNGGPISNWIYGYYVVDIFGSLTWAQRDDKSPVPISLLGNTYGFIPSFAVGSKFNSGV